MAITDIVNTNTTAGSVTRIIELGVEAIGFGILCGVKKDTKEIRSKENDILAAARNLESDNKVLLSNSKYVADWVKDTKKNGIPIQLTQQDINVAVKSVFDQAQQPAPAPTQQPAQQPVQQPMYTQADINAAVEAALAKKETSAPNITNIVNGGDTSKETPAQQPAPAQQAPVQQPATQTPVITQEQLDAATKAAANEAAKAAVAEYIASQQNDANKGKGGK